MVQQNDARRITRAEATQISVIIGQRTKLFKAKIAEQGAKWQADFDKKLAAQFSYDQDPIWREAHAAAERAVTEGEAKIAARCQELRIPPEFAPGIQLAWYPRGENASRERRAELRRAAMSEIAALTKAATVHVETIALEERTQVMSLCVLSDAAREFLESFKPVNDALRELDFAAVERKLLGADAQTAGGQAET